MVLCNRAGVPTRVGDRISKQKLQKRHTRKKERKNKKQNKTKHVAVSSKSVFAMCLENPVPHAKRALYHLSYFPGIRLRLESCDSRFCNTVDLNNTDSIFYSNREYRLKRTLELHASAGRVARVHDSGIAFTVSFRCNLKNSEHQL